MDVFGLNIVAERIERQKNLKALIKESHGGKNGIIFLSAGYEREREQFYQESSFEYFVGIQEPAVIFYQPLDALNVLNDSTTLYVPQYTIDRTVWLPTLYDEEKLAVVGIEREEPFGEKIPGYSTSPFYSKEALSNLCNKLELVCQQGDYIFAPLQDISVEVMVVMEQLYKYVPLLRERIIDISPLITTLRQKKTQQELEYMYHAVEITAMAHQAAAGIIKKGNSESDVQAAIEYIYTESNARKAFTSIVGSGINSTILHYIDNKDALPADGLVVVDIGASFNHYCADITRTYPVSGAFSQRQKEVYQDVLDTQEYISECAKPGVYLNNKNVPENSLNHLAHEFLRKRGYDVEKDFPHGIGHFVGLDVHDVGNYSVPLALGDVITIEPGIYLRQEKLGVRIEDMYWIVKDGAICLSEEIPKKIKDIERFMRESHFTEVETVPSI